MKSYRMTGGQITGFATVFVEIVELPGLAIGRDEAPAPVDDGQVIEERSR